MEKSINIRSLKQDDMDRIYEIEAASIKHLTPLSLLSSYYRITANDFLVAEIGGHVIGYVVTIRDAQCYFEGHVLSIAVDPNYRRQGVGTALILKSMDMLRNNGSRKLYLEVKESNSAAREFYRKLGFREIGRYRRYYQDGEDAIRMVKRLK